MKNHSIDDERGEIIFKVLAQSDFNGWVDEVYRGSTFCRYVLGYEPGSFKRSVLSLEEDLAFNLSAKKRQDDSSSSGFPSSWHLSTEYETDYCPVRRDVADIACFQCLSADGFGQIG